MYSVSFFFIWANCKTTSESLFASSTELQFYIFFTCTFWLCLYCDLPGLYMLYIMWPNMFLTTCIGVGLQCIFCNFYFLYFPSSHQCNARKKYGLLWKTRHQTVDQVTLRYNNTTGAPQVTDITDSAAVKSHQHLVYVCMSSGSRHQTKKEMQGSRCQDSSFPSSCEIQSVCHEITELWGSLLLKLLSVQPQAALSGLRPLILSLWRYIT